jgi:hypothetical protein
MSPEDKRQQRQDWMTPRRRIHFAGLAAGVPSGTAQGEDNNNWTRLTRKDLGPFWVLRSKTSQSGSRRVLLLENTGGLYASDCHRGDPHSLSEQPAIRSLPPKQ